MADDVATQMPDEPETRDENTRKKSVGGRIERWGFGILAVLALLVAGLVAGLNSPVGKRWITDQMRAPAPPPPDKSEEAGPQE